MALAREFFASPVQQKMRIAMAHGGRAWRGYFPVDGEFDLGAARRKEGIYFGTELGLDDPRVRAELPLHARTFSPRCRDFATRFSPI